MTLIDLLIMVGLLLLGSVIAPLVLPAGRFPQYVLILFQVAAAVVTYVIGASFIYRRMLFWPLLFPICPHCRKRPDIFEITGAWPAFTMSCGSCNGKSELRMRGEDHSEGGTGLPCLQLNWPYFLGWYKRVR